MADDTPASAAALEARVRDLEARLAVAEHERLAADEKVRELAIDLERAQERNRVAALQSDQLLAGIEVMNEARRVEDLFRGMLDVLRGVLGFDEAFLIVFEVQGPRVVAATDPRLLELRWAPGAFTSRALAGRPLALYDVERNPEWSAIDPELRGAMRSAIHVPLQSERSQALLVCGHRDRGFFTAERINLARRFAGLASQALHNAEHHRELEARVAERTAALAYERDFAQQITMSLAQGLVTTDAAGLITVVNPAFAAMCGLPVAQLIGRPLVDYLADASGAPLPAQPEPGNRELYLRGDPGLALVLVSTANRSSGAASEVIHVLTDLRERQRMEAALAQARDAAQDASRAKSHFLANMSHELRTPLNAIIGYCEMLIEDAEGSGAGDLAADLGKIHGASTLLLELIGNILDLSKIEAGRMEVWREPVDVAAMIRQIGATIAPLAARQRNTLAIDVDGALVTLDTDPLKLRQILLNLLGNACKFTEDGTIRLHARRELADDGRPWAVFEVADTGIGMTEEQCSRAFQAFTQVEASSTRRDGGTGLGLTLARRFAELLGGAVDVTSAPSVGSTFVLRLPVEPD